MFTVLLPTVTTLSPCPQDFAYLVTGDLYLWTPCTHFGNFLITANYTLFIILYSSSPRLPAFFHVRMCDVMGSVHQ